MLIKRAKLRNKDNLVDILIENGIITKIEENISVGFYLCVSNIIVMIVTNFICNYIM